MLCEIFTVEKQIDSKEEGVSVYWLLRVTVDYFRDVKNMNILSFCFEVMNKD